MFSPKKKLNPPETFVFPFTPYTIQDELMRALYNVLENREIGIFESPTGMLSNTLLIIFDKNETAFRYWKISNINL